MSGSLSNEITDMSLAILKVFLLLGFNVLLSSLKNIARYDKYNEIFQQFIKCCLFPNTLAEATEQSESKQSTLVYKVSLADLKSIKISPHYLT